MTCKVSPVEWGISYAAVCQPDGCLQLHPASLLITKWWEVKIRTEVYGYEYRKSFEYKKLL
jgi:hypothetical protein